MTVGEAFERSQARSYELGELIAGTGGARLIGDKLAGVEASERIVVTGAGWVPSG